VRANVVRFTGGIHDETTGLTKFGRRCYDPNLDRFTRQDTPTSSLERRSFASALGGNGGRMNREDPWRRRMSRGPYALGVVGCTLVAASMTLILGLATAAFTLNSIRRTDFERVRQLQADLTTGPVAAARHIVGSAMEDRTRAGRVDLDDDQIQALYLVLWCFERIDGARATLLGRWRYLPNWLSPRRSFDDSIRTHVRIYYDYIHRAAVAGTPVRVTLTATEDDPGLLRPARRLQVTNRSRPRTNPEQPPAGAVASAAAYLVIVSLPVATVDSAGRVQRALVRQEWVTPAGRRNTGRPATAHTMYCGEGIFVRSRRESVCAPLTSTRA
jgi:RHS repeat-associated protein